MKWSKGEPVRRRLIPSASSRWGGSRSPETPQHPGTVETLQMGQAPDLIADQVGPRSGAMT